MTLAQLISDTNDVKTTDSGLVEWNNNSLQVVVDDITELFLERGVYQVADVATMQNVSGEETNAVAIDGTGLFLYAASGTPNYSTTFPASGGGIWKLQYTQSTSVTELADLDDVNLSSPTDGQVLSYDSATSKWINSSVVVNWSTLSDKPRVIQEMTFGSVLSTYNIGFDDILPDATANAYGNIFIGAVDYPFVEGTYNVVLAPRSLSDHLGGDNSVILTPRTALRDSPTGTQEVNNSLILGDPGALDDFQTSNNLDDMMAIGVDGVAVFVRAPNGRIHYKYAGLALSFDHLFDGSLYASAGMRCDGTFDCNGVADFSGQVTVNGVLIAPTILVDDWTDFTTGERGTGWLYLANNVPCWRINPMGKVTFTGALYANTATPDNAAITFADSSITPDKNHVFSLGRTSIGVGSTGLPCTGVVTTSGVLEVYYDDFTDPATVVVWLSSISYYID